MRETAIYKRYAQGNLRGGRVTRQQEPGAVVVVGATGALGAPLAAALARRRRIRAVLRQGESATDLLGEDSAEFAWETGSLDWGAVLSDGVVHVSRRGGCAGFQRGGGTETGACPLGDVRALVLVFEEVRRVHYECAR